VLITQRRLDRAALRVAGGFTVAVALGTVLAAGVFGTAHFREFAHDLELQTAPISLSPNTMGLGVALAYRGEMSGPGDAYYRRGLWRNTVSMRGVKMAIAVVAIVALGASLVLRRKRETPSGPEPPAVESEDSLSELGFVVFALLLTSMVYYWTFALCVILMHVRWSGRSRLDAAAIVGWFVIETWASFHEAVINNRHSESGTVSILISLYCLALIGLRLHRVLRRKPPATAPAPTEPPTTAPLVASSS
jgi:hypothetical protein